MTFHPTKFNNINYKWFQLLVEFLKQAINAYMYMYNKVTRIISTLFFHVLSNN